MKKLHRFVLKELLGPFFIILIVLVFIFLVQFIMNYMDELAGKGAGIGFFAKISFYFSFKMIPRSMPLALLLASLMTFGNLGQFNELTAIKSAGISLPKIMLSSFLFAVVVAISSFCINNFVVPKTNLKGYKIFYDVRKKEATFDLKEKAFYSGIPGYSIRVNKKYPDGKSLNNVIVYDHSDNAKNTTVIIADSGSMYTIMGEKYLSFNLFNGCRYTQMGNKAGQDFGANGRSNSNKDGYTVSKFDSSTMMFDMSTFAMADTPEELFKHDRRMLNVVQLYDMVDSINREQVGILDKRKTFSQKYNEKREEEIKEDNDGLVAKYDSLMTHTDEKIKTKALRDAVNNINNSVNQLSFSVDIYKNRQKDKNYFKVDLLEKITGAVACIIMFLIGAPIGSVIKKGGLGIPILVGVCFFIFYYMSSVFMNKNAKEGVLPPEVALWIPNFILLLFALWFMDRARKDARLFETDRYVVLFQKFVKLFKTTSK